MRRLGLALAVVLALSASAEALTIRDIIELSRAGLGEDVLLALIDVDRGVYPIDAKTLTALKEAGVSEKVIVALVRSGRERPVEPPPPPPVVEEPPAPEPQVVVIDHHDQPDAVREVPVLVPVFVTGAPAFPQRHGRRFPRATTDTSTFIPFQSGPPVQRPEVKVPPQPVYWGFGGKLRPDAWNPEPPKPQTPRGHDDRKRQ